MWTKKNRFIINKIGAKIIFKKKVQKGNENKPIWSSHENFIIRIKI